MNHKVGDRVMRLRYWDDVNSWKYGVITEVYKSTPNRNTGHFIWQYAVKWEDGEEVRGYMINGLCGVAQSPRLDTVCDNDIGDRCFVLWPTDIKSWCEGCRNYAVHTPIEVGV